MPGSKAYISGFYLFMSKVVFIAEKPSVAQQFADALGLSFKRRDGYIEAENTIVTWCVGHLVTMCYPDAYDEKYKRWDLATIPFIPSQYKYQIIDDVRKQFNIVKKLLTDPEVETIYICTDSGREGEYIYRLVAQEAGVRDKKQLRVWIDSQTKEEILRGIRQAKDDSEYDHLGAAAYLRAKEDYLMGINFSRALTLKYSSGIRNALGTDRCVIAVGRVMTCVLGIVVRREREIRDFVKTPFFKLSGLFGDPGFSAEWQVQENSSLYGSPFLYKDNGFLKREDAENLVKRIQTVCDPTAVSGSWPIVSSVSRKKETKNPPLLYNLAELQNDCSRFFKISPDETLKAAQELYEKKLTTYPRTDARVLSSAVAKEIVKNLKGISAAVEYREYCREIEASGSYKTIGKSRYTNDKAITDHYAIIPTGQGQSALSSCSPTVRKVYEVIVRRFLSVFYPPAVFDKIAVQMSVALPESDGQKESRECFNASVRCLKETGYLKVLEYSFGTRKEDSGDPVLAQLLSGLKKGAHLPLKDIQIKEGETQPPSRYNSGSMILTMENAGRFIEEEELREQIRGSGIGTSATRAEILNKLIRNQYLNLNKKTQIITPTVLGEMIYDTVDLSVRALLDPKLTASWELGLTRVSEGSVTEEEYLRKLNDFIVRRTNHIKENKDAAAALPARYEQIRKLYPGQALRPGSSHSGKRTAPKTGPRKSTKA